MSDPMLRAQARGCLGSAVAMVVVPAVTVAIFAGAGVAAMAFPAGSVERVVAFSVAIVALMGAFVVAALLFAARRTRALDPAFAALGVTPSGSLLNIREFHGPCPAIGGRTVDALFARRGPVLETHVSTALHTTLAVGTRTALGTLLRDAVGATEVAHNDPALGGFVVTADDPDWARAALGDPAFRDVVLRAVSDRTGNELRVFALRPGAVRLTRRYFSPDAIAHEIKPMIELLASAAAIVERFPPPPRAVQLSAVEQRARTAPTRMGVLIALGLVGVVLVGTVCIAGVMIAATASDAPRQHRRHR